MDLDANKALINRIGDALNRQDLEALAEFMSPEVAASFKEDMQNLYMAFPDYHGSNVEQIAEGNKVVNRYVYYGTHKGTFMGIPPTGNVITFRGISIDEVVDGKVVAIDGLWDIADILAQLGRPIPAG